MGEIADAIRRARGQGSTEGGEVALRGLDLATPELERVPDRPERDGELEPATRSVERIEPQNPAVLPDVGPQAELSRQIALRLRERLEELGANTVAVVSAERGDGKSTVACNLAVALASMTQGRSVALVDLDMRRPSLARYLGLAPSSGMDRVLLGHAALEDARISIEHPAIDVYPVLHAQSAAHELLARPVLGEVLAELGRRYGTVLIDTPPAPLVPDASLILRHVGISVPVVRKGKTRNRSLKRMVDCLPAGKFAGWIMNCDRSSGFRDDEYYYQEGTGR